MMKSIGIIGAGVAGLHLGLQLRQHGIATTIYTNRTPEEVADGRVMNSVAHMHVTLELEEDLGINHWTEDQYYYTHHYHYNGWGDQRTYQGSFAAPSRTLDYRIYLPRLMEDFTDRGGVIEYRDLGVADIQNLSEIHDLVVVSTGKGEIGAMFPKRADKSPYDRPQRKLAVGFWKGVERCDPNGVAVSVIPGVGELLAIPMWSFSGDVMALLFESVPGGPQEALTDQRYADDPEAYRRLTLNMLRDYHPTVFDRVDHDEFRLQSDKDILQGAFTPVMREDYARLPNGRFLLALGDVHLTMDPVQAQGANSTAYSARVVGDAIVEDDVFDERFMKKVASRRSERLEAANDWINTIIHTPTPPQIPALFSAMVDNQALVDEFTENFNHPIRQIDLLASEERVEAAVNRASA
ncbi:styrene monooxygenase/indole monooxygenase family protein [Brevibacterium marinum]|jgi:2-polyprenyl-6-methoxyphenol hydroxylase-like FAD-dependent oxidoreductase|uniref:2-polyprenyl-6-methoxyphenol hydroxylase-like FAD-dependent oxidoreductase n=1 Tax=Brevibacterium marinum TaxID=418643 RepID=A0A846S4E0_9MICO|nr:styrene monooxygenase/indole monooxygenase family protein [Brevibacterium marinum]NJC58625.1 2-polyprenyl-6-methoxyphenol hydroxylase-like FAD-dependent oxidoreductase [Brevibacterium marinum]